jgi:hypothetical protein
VMTVSEVVPLVSFSYLSPHLQRAHEERCHCLHQASD